MNIILKEITLHHFLSFDETTINLQDRGFCLVSGINRNPKDAAKSNGAGKSTIWNAISFVLTGETLNGLKSNLGNIYFNDGCWVRLSFTIDGINYILTRSKEDKKLGTNLKIEVNGEDKSGKGIRESEVVLAEILPDITSELIGSVMILGQGMPSRFTNNTPSRRKEMLEHLSKSDFMIQDLKDRVEKRYNDLSNQSRDTNTKITEYDSKCSVYETQLKSLEEELEKSSQPVDYDFKINLLEQELKTILDNYKTTEEEYNNSNIQYDIYLKEYQNRNNAKNETLTKLRIERENFTTEFNSRKNDLIVKEKTLEAEINRLESITDVCPTCGQKIPGAIKPDTIQQKQDLENIKNKIKELNIEIEEDNNDYKETLLEVDKKYDSYINESFTKANEFKQKMDESSISLKQLTHDNYSKSMELSDILKEKDNYNTNIKKLKESISQTKQTIKELKDNSNNLKLRIEDLNKHSDVVSKMMTFLKRDFRGYLLENIINYISTKAKEYCNKIFGSDEILFQLNGNNIDISYCNKDYDNLSGGEKQRVDLIIQFAIRDMLVNYLGFNSNILVLDEITDNLDSLSCEKVLNFITEELTNIESVFIISHHSDELEIPCDSEIIVQKDIRGVSEVL